MASDEEMKKTRTVEARARNISHNVRCTECGSQSIEDSQADVAILLRKLIRDEIRAGKSDKEIYKKLEEDFGETVLYTPRFDWQTAGLWLSPVQLSPQMTDLPSVTLPDIIAFLRNSIIGVDQVIVAGAAAGVWAYQRHRKRTNVHIMALNLVRGVPLTPLEKETMLDLLTPPPAPR